MHACSAVDSAHSPINAAWHSVKDNLKCNPCWIDIEEMEQQQVYSDPAAVSNQKHEYYIHIANIPNVYRCVGRMEGRIRVWRAGTDWLLSLCCLLFRCSASQIFDSSLVITWKVTPLLCFTIARGQNQSGEVPIHYLSPTCFLSLP
jgi:hypothetical protein